MERQSTVQTTSVTFEGQTYSASYFVENNIINANIGGRVMMTPLGPNGAEKTVQTLLTGHLLQNARKSRHAGSWSKSES